MGPRSSRPCIALRMASGPGEKRACKHRGSHDGHTREPASVAAGAAEPENRLHGSADAAVVAVVAAAVTTSTVSTAAIHAAAVVSAHDAAPIRPMGGSASNLRCTSTPAVPCAQIAAIPRRRGERVKSTPSRSSQCANESTVSDAKRKFRRSVEVCPTSPVCRRAKRALSAPLSNHCCAVGPPPKCRRRSRR